MPARFQYQSKRLSWFVLGIPPKAPAFSKVSVTDLETLSHRLMMSSMDIKGPFSLAVTMA